MTEFRAFLDRLHSAADIVEVVGQYVPLKRSGTYFKGLCPFHKEKTPSFMVSREKQLFHCYGCGVGGDVISFVQKQERLEFRDAVELLAQRFQLPVPRFRRAE
ncbi:MAG: CHC2 zinc finger domain-containing protein, partial [bacterium]